MNEKNPMQEARAEQPKSKRLSSLIWIFVLWGAHAYAVALDIASDEDGCRKLTQTSPSYLQKVNELMNIKEVIAWKNAVEAKKRRIAMTPMNDNTWFHDGQCFWEINLYEDTGDQLQRSRAYQLALDKNLVFRVDFSEPEKLIRVQNSKK